MTKQKTVDAENVDKQQTEQEVVKNAPEESESAEEKIERLEAENAKLHKTVARLQSSADKSDAYLTQLVAIKNDFDSYKRRMKLNAEQARLEGVQSVALKLIEIAATFKIALKHLKDEETIKAFEMVHQQFVQTLHGFGIVEMDVSGKEFDHMTMNALSQMDYGAENSGKVVEVYKNGYTMNDKVLRYAEVIVGA